ncbi:hypothetical protein GWO43_25905 [candidate division KSB1 bacterium]|nr:hypothetical protein [candidate division KSB1 bacterium]NIR69248.1 hypothetical protein [candidate division KSB1 bacterium]NIS27422.1 hypothetical protein [candidate division KSB1 bacterium]NIT74247.1 hypothetical protein [candidate division KSB1 bacterium]NIU28139.1 hypothetical protein [candidate division KSB1 bacterium]
MAKRENELIDKILSLSDDVRYVAVYRYHQLESKSKEGTHDASSSETDLYEELLVNPTLLKLASQRGNIDCGGLDYLLVNTEIFFNSFYQYRGGMFLFVLTRRQIQFQ